MFVIISFFGYLFRDKPFYWIGILLIILWTVIYKYVYKYRNDPGVKALLEKFSIFQKENNQESYRQSSIQINRFSDIEVNIDKIEK